MKKGILVLLINCACICMSGCTYTKEVVERETGTLSFEKSISTEFGKNQTSVSETIPISNEPFDLVCTYDTKDYPLEEWRVTSNKNIYMTVNTSGLPEGYAVHIEHVHADIILKSTSPSIDGITQDSMDDSDHRSPSVGFPITDTVSYNNVFAIEGYTDQFYTLWEHAFGSYGGMYGSVSSSYERLTESNIRKAGTYAEKLIVVYDLIISTPSFPEGYVKSIYSEVLIPLVSEVSAITIYGTYECTNEFEVDLEDSQEQKMTISVGSRWTCENWNEATETVTLYSKDSRFLIPLSVLKENFVLKETS